MIKTDLLTIHANDWNEFEVCLGGSTIDSFKFHSSSKREVGFQLCQLIRCSHYWNAVQRMGFELYLNPYILSDALIALQTYKIQLDKLGFYTKYVD